MSFFKNLFGANSQIEEYLAKGARVIDVRSPQEYTQGNVPESINIPLDTIKSSVEKIKKYDSPIILVCASGMRSGNATRVLQNEGIDCINGGGWHVVYNQMEKTNS